MLFSLGEIAGRKGRLEESKKYFIEADDIYRKVFGSEYPWYRQQIFNKYARLVHYYYMLFFMKYDSEIVEQNLE